MRKHTKKRDYRDAVLFYWPYRKNFSVEIKLADEIEEWCDKNLLNDFTIGNAGIYVYEDWDIMAYKLRWI